MDSTQTKFWGYHLILDCARCDASAITSADVLREFTKALVEDIKMNAYGEPQILHFGHNEVHLSGWTVVQLIETSNITGHFCDHSREGYIDIFSCKPFDNNVAIACVNRFLKPEKIRVTYLTRQAD